MSRLISELEKHTSSKRKISRILENEGIAADDRVSRRRVQEIVEQYYPEQNSPEEDFAPEEEMRDQPPSSVDLSLLTALTKFYVALPPGTPYKSILLRKMQNVTERLEPSEVGEPNIDTVISVSDRIRQLYPRLGKIEKETLFEIGKRAKMYHIDVYDMPPTKVERDIDGEIRRINAYTEQSAPDTLDRAIREIIK